MNRLLLLLCICATQPLSAMDRPELKILSLLAPSTAALGMNPLDNKLLKAAAVGKLEEVERLITCGATVDARNKHKSTPLHKAARHGHYHVCRVLIENYAPVNAKDINKQTPLHIAAFRGCVNISKLLIENNATVDARDSIESTPLHLAAHKSHYAACRALLENKATVNALNLDRATPLHYAAYNGKVDICTLLIQNKALVDIKTNQGWTPLSNAASLHTRELSLSNKTVCILLIDTMIQQIQESQANAIVLLGMKNYCQSAYLTSIDQNILIIIAKLVHAHAIKQQKSLFAQIYGLATHLSDSYKLRKELKKYARNKFRHKINKQ